MLTYLDFNALTESEQAEAVWKGTFLDDRVEGGQHVQLYRLDGFYVEVLYDPVSNSVSKFSAFNSSTSLAPYINLK
jgi:hypothetical protein